MTAKLAIIHTRLRNGCWEGLLSGAADLLADHPEAEEVALHEHGSETMAAALGLTVAHRGAPLAGLRVTPLRDAPGLFRLSFDLPATLLNEGEQSLIFSQGDSVLARFSLVAGASGEADVRVELDLLREEVALLKRAFRASQSAGL